MSTVLAGTPCQPRTLGRVSATPVTGAALLVGVRVGLWIAIQVLVAAVIVIGGLPGAAHPLNAAAAWWMSYAVVVDLGTVGALLWLIRHRGISYRSVLGPPTAAWQVGIGAVGVFVASMPAVFFGAELNAALYVDSAPPMFAVVDVPAAVGIASALVAPLLAEFVEPILYLGLLLPALERRLGSTLPAAVLTTLVWAGEHAFYPVLTGSDGLDMGFAAYRVVSVLPFLASWVGTYYVCGRRLLPVIAARWVFNGGTALAVALGLV